MAGSNGIVGSSAHGATNAGAARQQSLAAELPWTPRSWCRGIRAGEGCGSRQVDIEVQSAAPVEVQ